MAWWTEIITLYNRLLAQGRVTWLIKVYAAYSRVGGLVY